MKKNNFAKRVLFGILFVLFLPLFLIVYLFKAIARAVQYSNWKKNGKLGKSLLLSSDITKIDIMPGYEFEEYLKALFFYAGYEAKITQKSKDFGADLLLEKDGQTIAVQAKRYNKTVGAKSVQEVYSAKEHYGTDVCSVVTNNHFSSQAETLAKELGVQLIDREELIEMARQVCATIIDDYDDKITENTDFYNNPNRCAI